MKAGTSGMKTDPVCGMQVPEISAYRATRNGETFHFCSDRCRRSFLQHPSEYLISGMSDHPMPSETVAMSETKIPMVPAAKKSAGWKAYIPLFAVIASALLAATALQSASASGWHGTGWMSDFMGLFLVLFATLKFFDLKGFADGFERYDLLASAARPYGFLYPFIEFGLGLAYLSQLRPAMVNALTGTVMIFGALGVLRSLRRGDRLSCACMGSALNVPLSKVALIEDLSMAAMAFFMLTKLHG